MAIEKERLSPDAAVPRWVWLEHLARYDFGARFAAGKVVLDCACGAGIGSETFARAGAASVAAFDVSREEVDRARARTALPNLTFQHGSALALPVASHSIDVYISFETIEHIDEDRAFLREAQRVLKTDGVFVCSTPNRAVTNPGASLAHRPWNRFHVREYSRDEFVALLREFFPRVELYGQNPKPAWLAQSVEGLGRILPMHGAVRLNQVMKLPQLVVDSQARHAVRALEPGCAYEYLVAVCRGSGAAP
ncbi:MAG TPA: class I SAM-dependent methyltransferase [Nitrospiria bacterium]|nr:class I SAM-dependent methyltransferase [Nitrospiria bacterium]